MEEEKIGTGKTYLTATIAAVEGRLGLYVLTYFGSVSPACLATYAILPLLLFDY